MTANRRPSPDDLLADELRTSVGRFVRHFRGEGQLPPNQAAVLGLLAREGPMSRADLARVQRVRHQSMRRTVELLIDAGHVSQELDPQDRRQHLLALTPTGDAALTAERLNRGEAIAEALRSLAPHHREVASQMPAILDLLREAQPK